jgi:hypothetical protein
MSKRVSTNNEQGRALVCARKPCAVTPALWALVPALLVGCSVQFAQAHTRCVSVVCVGRARVVRPRALLARSALAAASRHPARGAMYWGGRRRQSGCHAAFPPNDSDGSQRVV